MVHKLVNKLIINNIIKAEEKDIYLYGLQQGLVITLNILTTIVIGLFFGMVWHSILFMVTYIPLRIYAGGYHARTQLRCYLFSIALTSLVLVTIDAIKSTSFFVMGLALILNGIIILALAPVEDSNKQLSQIEIAVYKKRTRNILMSHICIVLVLYIFSLNYMAFTIVVSISTVSIMLILGKVLAILQNADK